MIMLALLVVDRYDLALAFQVWVSAFMRALEQRVVSNNENDWAASRESALEYLARGRLMAMVARFCDGVVSGVDEQAARGLALVRQDVPELAAELDAWLAERTGQLSDALNHLSDDPETLRKELSRVLEITSVHRGWLGAAAVDDAPADTEIAAAAPPGAAAQHFTQHFVTPTHDPNDPEAAAQAHVARFFRPG